MEFLHRINTKAKAYRNSGYGSNANNYGGRYINKDGTANVKRIGLNYFSHISWFHTLLDMSFARFMMVILFFYIAINFIFATIYFFIGVEYLNGIDSTKPLWIQFGEVYFFSAQTFTTVGYGHISPIGFLTSTVSAIEALVGLLSFALATGLFFGRFSKPKAHLKFSHNAIIAPYNGNTALMMKVSPYKNTNFTDAEVKITLGMTINEDGIISNKFYDLELEMKAVNSLNLSWTLVHPITVDSPLYGLNENDFLNTTGEVIVFLKVFDDMYSAVVTAKTSYSFNEIIYGAKFKSMFSRDSKNSKTILNLNKLNDFENVKL